jgi:hypothetical protein
MRCVYLGPSNALLLRSEADACLPTDLVALTQEEASKALLNPVNLTLEEGSQIAFAIVACWAVAVVYRLLSQIIKNDGFSSELKED